MKFPVSVALSVGSLPILVAGHSLGVAAQHLRHARQAPSGAPSSAPSGTPVNSSPVAGSSGAPPASGSQPVVSGVSGSVTGSVLVTTPVVTFTLQATNPTAVPLSQIVSTASAQPTIPLATTFPAGAQPSLAGAPPLPNVITLNPANYPALDKPPPTDSPEVQQWKQDVANSGVVIPNIPPTMAGGCPANAAAAADQSRCWWTCGGCTRPGDVVECPDKMTWGLTYDDGPGFYTPNLLSYLDSKQLKSTFFSIGSRAISMPTVLQAEYMGGHQIAVHTWSHPALTTLENDEIIAELGWTKKVIKDILGVTPNMMRPPFGDIDDRVRAICIAMGLTPVMWTRISPTATFDTDDFNIHGGLTTVQQVLQNWENILGNVTTINSGFIVLEHDLFQQTVEVATGYILPDALAHNPAFKIQPVINCLNKPNEDAYIETNDNKTNPPPISAPGVTLTSVAGSQATADGSKSGTVSSQARTGLALAFVATIAVLLL